MTGKENNETGLARDGKPQGGGLLEVIVHSAEDVEGRHHTNPYAKVLFRGDEKKTQVCGFIILDVTNCQLGSKSTYWQLHVRRETPFCIYDPT